MMNEIIAYKRKVNGLHSGDARLQLTRPLDFTWPSVNKSYTISRPKNNWNVCPFITFDFPGFVILNINLFLINQYHKLCSIFPE